MPVGRVFHVPREWKIEGHAPRMMRRTRQVGDEKALLLLLGVFKGTTEVWLEFTIREAEVIDVRTVWRSMLGLRIRDRLVGNGSIESEGRGQKSLIIKSVRHGLHPYRLPWPRGKVITQVL